MAGGIGSMAAICARDYAQYERVLAACIEEFERAITGEVEREFARALELLQAGESCEIPWIGGEFPPEGYRDGLQARVGRALCAREWFRHEAPAWAQPLPLTETECQARFNRPSPQRLWVIGSYGQHLRAVGWDLEYAQPFDKYAASRMTPMPRQRSR